MAEPPIDIPKLLELVGQVLKTCTESTAMSEALASLLIDKGCITREEFDARVEEQAKQTKQMLDALNSPSHEA